VLTDTGITAYLENGCTVEKAKAIAAHESPRTTKLYDRTNDELTLDEIKKSIFDGEMPKLTPNCDIKDAVVRNFWSCTSQFYAENWVFDEIMAFA
jgi:hypothetical protein